MITLNFTRRFETSPAILWAAITEPAIVSRYHFVPLRELALKEGGVISYGTPEKEMIVGRVLEVLPGERLTHTFRFTSVLPDTANDPETTVCWSLKEQGETTGLTLSHSGFPEENATHCHVSGGWPHLLDQLEALMRQQEG